MAIYVPQGRQFGSLYGNRRIPYRAFIESQIPSLYAKRKYQEDKALADQRLALERESLDLSGKELDESTRQSEESLALQRELAGESGKQAKLGLGISGANTAITGAYLGKKLGLGKKIAGVFGDKAVTTAPAVSAGPAGAVGLGGVSMAGEADVAGLAAGEAAMGSGAGAGAGTGGVTIGGVSGSAAGAAGVGAGAAAFLAGTADFWSHWGERTGPSALAYLRGHYSGVKEGTDMGYGQSMPGSDWFSNDYNVASLLSGLDPNIKISPDSPLVRMVRNKEVGIEEIGQLLGKEGTWTDPTAH